MFLPQITISKSHLLTHPVVDTVVSVARTSLLYLGTVEKTDTHPLPNELLRLSQL